MSAIQPRDILAYVGGRSLTQYGVASRRFTRIARSGEAQVETLTRADASTCAGYRGSDGLYHLAGPNILRPHYLDLNADGIFETPGILLEPAAVINRLVQARALATTWVGTAITATNGAVTGVDGVLLAASKLVPTAVLGYHLVDQGVTITSGEFLGASCFVQANGYTGCLFRFGDAASTNTVQCAIDLSAGSILGTSVNGAGVAGGSAIIPWGGGWYQVLLWGAINAAVTAAHVQVYAFDTGAHASSQTQFTGDGVSGINVDIVHLQRNGSTNDTPPAMPIITAAAAVTRSADLFSIPFWAPPSGTLSAYIKMVEMGNVILAGGGSLTLGIGSPAPATAPVAYLTASGGHYSGRWNDNVHTLQASAAAGNPTYGQLVEYSFTLSAGGIIQLTESIAGAAPTVSAASGGAGPLPTAFAQLKLFLAAVGQQTVVERAIVTDGFHTMQEFQAVV